MNVIVIMTDSMRVDHLGCYGNTWIKNPNIDKLASEGTVFERAYSEGLPTMPARTALFTGRYTFPFRGWQPVDSTDILLSEVVSSIHTTALIGDEMPRFTGFSRGFDYVERVRSTGGVKVDISHYHEKNGFRGQYVIEKSSEEYAVAQVVKAGIKWLESRNNEENWFLWLDCFDPHEPWNPPPPYDKMYTDPRYTGLKIIVPDIGERSRRGEASYFTEDETRHIRALYAGVVTLVDEWLGVFLNRVKDLGFWENTLIIYLSDHGEPLGEHGIIRKTRPWPYEELSHIPLIIRHPEGIGKGKRVDAFVDTTDIMPTILDFLRILESGIPEGVPMPQIRRVKPLTMHGHSLLPLLSGEIERVRDYAYSGYYKSSWSIRNEQYSFYLWRGPRSFKTQPELYRFTGRMRTPKPEEYDLERDLFEKDNLINKEPQIADFLELQLRRFVDNLTQASEAP